MVRPVASAVAVVAFPVTLPVTFPVTFPVSGPENAVAVSVPTMDEAPDAKSATFTPPTAIPTLFAAMRYSPVSLSEANETPGDPSDPA